MTRFEALGILPDTEIYGFSALAPSDPGAVLQCTSLSTPEVLVNHIPPHAVFHLRYAKYQRSEGSEEELGVFVHVSFTTDKGIVGNYLEPDAKKLHKLTQHLNTW